MAPKRKNDSSLEGAAKKKAQTDENEEELVESEKKKGEEEKKARTDDNEEELVESEKKKGEEENHEKEDESAKDGGQEEEKANAPKDPEEKEQNAENKTPKKRSKRGEQNAENKTPKRRSKRGKKEFKVTNMSPVEKTNQSAKPVMKDNLEWLEKAAKAKTKELGVNLVVDRSRNLGPHQCNDYEALKVAKDFWYCECLFLQIDIPKNIKLTPPVHDAMIDFLQPYDNDAHEDEVEDEADE